jgi:hypothetical protein
LFQNSDEGKHELPSTLDSSIQALECNHFTEM